MATRYPKVTGVADLKRAFNRLGAEMPKIARATTGAAANVIKKAIAAEAPVADGPYIVRQGSQVLEVPAGNIPKNVITKYVKPGEATGISEHLVVVRRKAKDGFANRIASLQEWAPNGTPFFKPAALRAMPEAARAAEKRFASRTNTAIRKLSTK